jgi:hypothetical protein
MQGLVPFSPPYPEGWEGYKALRSIALPLIAQLRETGGDGLVPQRRCSMAAEHRLEAECHIAAFGWQKALDSADYGLKLILASIPIPTSIGFCSALNATTS